MLTLIFSILHWCMPNNKILGIASIVCSTVWLLLTCIVTIIFSCALGVSILAQFIFILFCTLIPDIVLWANITVYVSNKEIYRD